MWRFDGHTHSSFSDGTQTPEELASAAAEAGLNGFALADHDTFAGLDRAAAAASALGLQFLPAVELSTSYEGNSAHLLAYLPRRDDPALAEVMEKIRTSRRNRLRTIMENISADYPSVTWEKLVRSQREQPKAGGELEPWGRPHVADLLVAEGIVTERGEAFERILSPAGPYFVHQWAPHPADTVALVVAAGGVPVLAHPRSQLRQRALPVGVVTEMVDAGLFGLEVHHREHSRAHIAELTELAARLGLRRTGGSDYHGAGKPNLLGENLTERAVVEEILELGSGPLS